MSIQKVYYITQILKKKKKNTSSELCDHFEKKNSYPNRPECFEIIVFKKNKI